MSKFAKLKRQILAFIKRIYILLLVPAFLLISGRISGQSKSYLFHINPFKDEHPAGAPQGRRIKIRMDVGLVQQFYANDPHYTTGTQGSGAYTIGLKLEIPVLKNADILVGGDFVRGVFNFNSYYFAKGYSFLYDGNEIYNHYIDMDELQIPFEYKINFSSETRNIKTFYATIGWMYRYLFYNNALITNSNNGNFVWEGQNDISSVFQLFGPQGSGIIEASLGYQHNALKSGNAWFFEIEYKYGTSPLLYLGNANIESNNIQFTLNTLSFKLGIRL